MIGFMPIEKRFDSSLVTLLIFAFVIRIAAAALFPNIHHPDEIFQIIEPAFRSLTGLGIETWEWRAGIRSWVIPGFLRQLIAICSAFGASREMVLMLIGVVFSVFSLIIVWVGYETGRATFGRGAGLAIGAACAVWPDLVMMAPKPMTEAIAADALVAAAFLGDRASRTDTPRPGLLAGIGVLLGLAFCIRFHIAFAVAAVALWTCRAEIRHRWLPLAAGAAVPLVGFGLVDVLTWGLPFQSIWKNFWINVVEDKSSSFGVQSPWFYFTRPFAVWGIAIVPVLYGLWRGARYAPLFSLCALTIWLSLSPIGHKELRFLFPGVPFVVIVSGLGCWAFLNTNLRRCSDGCKASVFIVTSVILAVSASTLFAFRDNWTRAREPLLLQQALRARPDLCGLGLVNVEWWDTGGYAYLAKSAPLYPSKRAAVPHGSPTSMANSTAFNYAITRGIGPISDEFRILQCINDVCLQRRDGGCTPDFGFELQRELKDTNQ